MHVFCIFVFAPVQRNLACFIWKGALEIHSLLYHYYYIITIIITTTTINIIVGLRNGHSRKTLIQNGEPQRSSWGKQMKRKRTGGG